MHRNDEARFAGRREIVEARQAASALTEPLIHEVIAALGPAATAEEINAEVLRRMKFRPDIQDAIAMAEMMEAVADALKPIAHQSFNDEGELVWARKDAPEEHETQ